jgi:hypothetical protein
MRDRLGVLWALGTIVVVVLLVLFVFDTSRSGGAARSDQGADTFTEQLAALGGAHDQGKRARTSLNSKGLPASPAMCGELFDATAASRELRWKDSEFVAKARQYFVNGCTGRPKPAG